jgi:hypothetical protein
MRPINAAIVLITFIASAHAVEQNVGVVFDPDARQIIFSPDNALAVSIVPGVAPAVVPPDTAPIEAPPLPRPKPSLHYVTDDNPAALISAFRHQHGEGSVAVTAVGCRVDDLGHPIRLNGVQLGASLAGKLSSELSSIASRDGSGE